MNRIVGIAASAGGVKALRAVIGGLPSSFAAPVLVVQHLTPDRRSMMAEILERAGPLHVTQAINGEEPQPGRVYVAPPDHHLLVDERGRLELTSSPLVHFLRPSADLLFESIAAVYGPRAIAVVLTGTGKDGSLGVQAIKKQGGRVILQDPETAEFPGMPEAARATGIADAVVMLSEIAGAILSMVGEDAS